MRITEYRRFFGSAPHYAVITRNGVRFFAVLAATATVVVATATAVVSLCHTTAATAVVVRREERATAVAAEKEKDDDNYPRIVVTAHNMLPPLKFGVHHIIC